MASMLGDKFSIMAVGPELVILGMLADKLKLYGLESRCASIRFLAMPVLELEKEKGEADQETV